MRLEAPGFSTLHVLPDLLDASGIHRITNQCAFLQQLTKMITVEGLVNNTCQPCPNLRLVTIPYGFQQ
jgi:hypothetical protein